MGRERVIMIYNIKKNHQDSSNSMSTYIYFLFLSSSCKIGNYEYLEVQSDVYRKIINSMHNIEFPITNEIKIHLPQSF